MSTSNRFGETDWPRFLRYVEKRKDGCWLWTGARRGNGRNEYGAFWCFGTQRAHIVSYVWTYGEPNCDLHHTCEYALCVNPEHVTPSASGQPRHRGPSPNYCAHGHEFTLENTYITPRGERQCRICLRAAVERHRSVNRDAINATRRERREHITYEPRPCPKCGTIYQPHRSDSRYCTTKDCINARQRENRNKRMGRSGL